ncbi:hypothetical protein L195_g005480 [Trifolium pratense]|uniref:Uncharacterized protein n=1 Tax=Trifolium pratense TaxID=57577 RepID=A0A2K3P0X7_TRIPR|nr:hypothetical protein L195_g005480 [Trifolium pratense]
MSSPVVPFVCPWACLASAPSKPSVAPPHVVSNRSFAQALLNKVDVSLTELPKPCLKGNSLSIKISEEVYQFGLANCNNYLHGRLVLSRGDQPLSSKDLREKLLQLWKPNDGWKMVPLGRGFFEFRFSCADDLRTVWVRFQYLPLEYWQPRILFEIAGAIGTPISIDENTRNHSFGHYARVLVDINMAGILPDSLWVEREKFAFDIEIEYENPPYFCFTCNSIGHSSDNCRKDYANIISREMVATKNDPTKKIKQVFVSKKHVDIVPDCTKAKAVVDEDPLLIDIIRSKEVSTGVLVRDVLNVEEELSPSISVGADLVLVAQAEEVRTTDLSEIPTPSGCGMSSSQVIVTDEVLDPNVARDLAILQHYWKENDGSGIGQRVYTDEEERAAAINFLKNREVATEEPFTDVVSKAKKKNLQKGFQVRNTRSRGRMPD